jgi:carbonic anhydrase
MVRADEALQRLLEGNKRFASSRMHHPSISPERRMEIIEGQKPFVVVLGCSDSRVPPELVFDQGLGDLFVVRTAGHVLDRIAFESIEYAVSHLGAPLVMVLAHSDCGAVTAAVSQRNAPPENVNRLVSEILPAVEEASSRQEDLVNRASKIHARRTAERLSSALLDLDSSDRSGSLTVVPAYYDLKAGLVEVLSEK